MHVKKIILLTEKVSLNIIKPKIDVPAIPIPVQIAYATDNGNFFKAIDKNTNDKIVPIIVKILGNNFEKPCENFNPIAHQLLKVPR